MNKQTIYPSTDRSLDLETIERMRLDMQQDVRRHYQSRTVAVTIPIFQALISGLLAGLLIAILLYALGTKTKWILIGLALTWIAVTAIVWWIRIKDWQSLIWNMEAQLGIDLTGDNTIGPPLSLKAEVSRNNGANKVLTSLEGSSLVELFESIVAGEPPTEARWTPSKNGFSKSQYWTDIGSLVRAGVLDWKNKDWREQGVYITQDGPSIVKQWLKDLEDETA